MLTVAFKRPRRIRALKLPQVYQILHNHLGALEIDIEICGCTIRKVPLDSESGINIMSKETVHGLELKSFESTPQIICLADQTRSKPLGILQDIQTVIGGVTMPLTYIILSPLMKMGYNVLIGRPWLYGAQVRTDWHKQRLQF